MEKRILVAGCSHYLREYIRNGLYYLSKEYYLRMLYKNYEVNNLSKKNLTSRDALLLIKAFTKVEKYEYCILSLGEGDLEAGIEKDVFRKNIMEIVSICNYSGVKIILQDVFDKKILGKYQEVIEEISSLYHLDKMNYKKGLLVA